MSEVTSPPAEALVLDAQEKEYNELVKKQIGLQKKYYEKLKSYEEQQRELELQEAIQKQQQLVSKLYENIQNTEFLGTGFRIPSNKFRSFSRSKDEEERWRPVDATAVYVSLVRFVSSGRFLAPTKNKTEEGQLSLKYCLIFQKKEKTLVEEEVQKQDEDFGDDQTRRSVRLLKAKTKSEGGDETVLLG